MASTYEPIATQTLGSNTLSVTFSSIPSTYTDLVLVTVQNNSDNTLSAPAVTFNSDTGSNYSYTYLTGTGSSAISGRLSSQSGILLGYYTTAGTTDGFMNIMTFPNYSNTTTFKTQLQRSNNGGGNSTYLGAEAIVSLWRNTSAISSITLTYSGTSRFATGSTFTLYGIKAA